MKLLTKSEVIGKLNTFNYPLDIVKEYYDEQGSFDLTIDEGQDLIEETRYFYTGNASLLTFEIAKKLKKGQKFGALVGHTFLDFTDTGTNVDKRIGNIEELEITNFYEGDGKTLKSAITSMYDEIEFDGSFNADYDSRKGCYVTGSGSDPIIVFGGRSRSRIRSRSRSRSKSRSRSPLKKRRGRPLGSKNKISKAKSPCEKGKVRDPVTKRCREKKKPGPKPRRSRSLSGGGCQKYCPQRWRINEMTGKRVYDFNHVFYENWVVPNGKLAMQRQNGWKCSYCSCITY